MMRDRAVAGLRRLAAVPQAVAAGIAMRRWQPASRLFLVGDRADWVIGRELEELAEIAGELGIRIGHPALQAAAHGQAMFLGNQFALLDPPRRAFENHLGLAYFHGRPGTPGMPELDQCFEALRAQHPRISRIQVSHREMREVVLSSGVRPEKVFVIPIAVNDRHFTPRTDASRSEARAELGIPEEAFVVGSFQKDGVGWSDGLEPKLIKGPDVFVDALEHAKATIPNLFVLLSGPARGYVKSRLEGAGIPYRHVFARDHAEIGRMTHALDAYLIASRQEGGPKAFLESLASGVPVVSTRVGQVVDLGRDRENVLLADVGDATTLAELLGLVAAGGPPIARLVQSGYDTAAEHTYRAQTPLWRELFDGFVEFESR
jgi:glycosyltransferase involved in cell wall biosynthesis